MKHRLIALAALAATTLPAAAALDVEGLSPAPLACTDFYKYANAKWLDATKIPDDRARWRTFDLIGERNERVLREAFDAAMKNPPAAGSAQRKVVDYYASGMDEPAILRANLTPLEKVLFAIGEAKDAAGL